MTGAADEASEAGTSREGEAGFVLLSVLLAVALFMAAAASFAIKSQLAAMQAGNRLEQARARALADGAVLFAVDALAQAQAPAETGAKTGAERAADAPARPSAPRPFAEDGLRLACPLSAERSIELSVSDEGGRLDLNAAPPEMIADLLRLTGLDGERAFQIAGAIVDFRDENDLPESGGASEAALYGEAGKPWGPRNGAFLDVAEIAQLPAFPPDLVARLQPLFTVDNARPGLDMAVMDRRARVLFPKETRGIEALERWRQPTGRKAFSIDAALRRADGTVAAARHGLVTFGGNSPEALAEDARKILPPRIRDWRETLVPPADPRRQLSASPICESLRRALEGEPGATGRG